MDDVFDVIDAIEAVEGIIERAPVRRRDRQDPFELHDLEFKGRYRFSKANVQRLSTMLAPFLEKQNNRGLSFTPLQIVCAGLDYLGEVTSRGWKVFVLVLQNQPHKVL